LSHNFSHFGLVILKMEGEGSLELLAQAVLEP
jgi:hypothetical protein